MKITHALRPDSRWDTWGQSRLRSSQRTLRLDTLAQLDDMAEGPDVDFSGPMPDWFLDEWSNWYEYQGLTPLDGVNAFLAK